MSDSANSTTASATSSTFASDLAKIYDPKLVETHWYEVWEKAGYFQPSAEGKPYTIVIPPPNVTGSLHMGHALNNTLQDVLIRYKKMRGFSALWVPGTDHASIATEAKVVQKLKAEGIDKNDLSRDKFLKHAWEWKEKHGGIILEQLKKLGASCDWDRTHFTMDSVYSKSVIKVFVDLYKKGKIYRGVRMVNWDPQAKTTVSDEEVLYREVNSKLYFVKYLIEGTSDEFVTVATTRPETILGDTAVCVNPNDPRFIHLKGKKVIVPIVNRVVPIIMDEYVDMEFGTGCLKITPAHDVNDYLIGQKYDLEVIDIFNDDGTLSEKAGFYIGQDRFAVRSLILEDLQRNNQIAKIEAYINKVGYSERTDAVIEPKISMQWFLAMKDISKPALENVMSDNISIYPPKFKNTYRHWMENVKDWCVSRQLWWGHRIPAWYLPHSHEFVVSETEVEALELARKKTGKKELQISDLHQDEDVLDTWFSSWLWPISVFEGLTNPNNKDIEYYYPTSVLVTAPEILFFWVARMIIAGYEYKNDLPFKDVYLTGIVRDKIGRKMSKSLGNSPDCLKLIDEYGADGVRVGMLLCSAAGNDLMFDEALPEQGRNFSNKIWNAFRLVKGWQVDETIAQPEHSVVAINWFTQILNETIAKLDEQYTQYRISEALMMVYKLFWDEFSSWYLEIVKPAYLQPIDAKTLQSTLDFFDKLMRLLHPFMPFITEEIWQHISERKDGESIVIAEMPKAASFNAKTIADFEDVKVLISEIRTVRKEKNIPIKDSLLLYVNANIAQLIQFNSVVCKLSNVSDIKGTSTEIKGAVSFRVKKVEFYIPLEGKIDIEEELKKIHIELDYIRGFLASVEKKLCNENFVSKAPATVLEIENKKKADALEKIAMLELRLESLKG